MRTKCCRISLLTFAAALTAIAPGLSRAEQAHPPRIVCLVSGEEYGPEKTMPPFMAELRQRLGYQVTILTPQKQQGFVGTDALKTADLLVLFAWRQPISKQQQQDIKDYLAAGKPLVGLRTATHSFVLRKGTAPQGLITWDDFNSEVLGNSYRGHSPDGNDITVASGAAAHPILHGIAPQGWHSNGSLYLVSPLSKDVTVLLMGRNGDVQEPVAWVHQYDKSRVFYTCLGHPDDFKSPEFKRLVTNAIQWALAPSAAPKTKAASAASVSAQRPNTKSLASKGGPLTPQQSARLFTVPADLEFKQVLSEPNVRQPVFLNFDEHGRMWVVQYLQYPMPAGLKMVSRDNYWRTIYDKVPPPPPHHFPGRDKITIHESSRGDGVFDKHRTFVDGLNIVTAVARGRGGVWVLNPPYLLFYPDANNDDVPDGDPVVHLAGFGLEDTHSVVNSLRWGPDGWLYGAQGSTVTSHVVRPGSKDKPIDSMGQLIWRYHPTSHVYEIFAEGGGNTFGVEFDRKGRIFSGHNGGDTRGFYYVQGGYCQKGFNKHGPLSNPYAFGYFPAMAHPPAPRFTHNFLIYDGGALPAKYNGGLMAVAPLQGEIVLSDISPNGSTFKTHDVGRLVTSQDHWFRPVDIKEGPDGAVYICDWYDGQVNHLRNSENGVDPTNGRIYRLQAKAAQPVAPVDMTRLASSPLVDLLGNKNIWYRQTALRLLGDRHDASVIPKLKGNITAGDTQLALESLWALNLCGGLTSSVALELLDHPDPFVRLWTIRLCCDDRQVPPRFAARLARLAVTEPNVEVRAQLACSARRLRAADCLPIVAGLIKRDEDVSDLQIPLLIWWAIEAKCEADCDAVLRMWQDRALWNTQMAKTHILGRQMQRFAMAGTQPDLQTCARLFALSPGVQQNKALMRGFDAAFQGRSMTALPDELIEALARAGGESLSLRIRRGDAPAIDEALKIILDPKADAAKRIQYVEVFGQTKQPRCVSVLIKLLAGSTDDKLLAAALTSLESYEQPQIGAEVLAHYSQLPENARTVAQTLLASRPAWARQFLLAIDAGRIDPQSVPSAVVRTILLRPDKTNAELAAKHFGEVKGATTQQLRDEIERLAAVVEAGTGSPYKGKVLFLKTCASCHRLFEDGGHVGPDLTSYRRDDLKNMLLNIVNPSAVIREGFENYTIETKDGRILTGVVAEQNNRVVTLRNTDGKDVLVAREDIEEMRVVPQSTMPERLLKPLSDQQIRDLFAYLRSGQPLYGEP